jgi:hypothetical protein
MHQRIGTNMSVIEAIDIKNDKSIPKTSNLFGDSSKKHIFLFSAYYYDPEIVTQFRKLERETRDLGDCVVLYHQKDGENIHPEMLKLPLFIVNSSMLSALGYPPLKDNKYYPGSGHFMLICFAREHEYEHYWYIEYDVYFSGTWSTLFKNFEDAKEDFLSCVIREYQDPCDWPWWESLIHHSENIPIENRYASFNLIFRISRSAIEFIDTSHTNGWIGHHEVLLPTLLINKGYNIRDLGGSGKYVQPVDKGRFYKCAPAKGVSQIVTIAASGSVFLVSELIPNNIYHPVKPDDLRQKKATST